MRIGPLGIWEMVFSMLLVALLLAIAVLLLRQLSKRSRLTSEDRSANRTEDPLEIAKRRYARGEIDQEEFKRLRRELE